MSQPGLDPSLDALPGSGPVTVAFSGGGDSVCLLHQVRNLARTRGLLAVHVDHGLDRGSAGRAVRAVELAAGLGVDCCVEQVKVRRSGSLEANARHARYQALARHLADGSVLLTGHHADDLAETMILRLLRGAGPGGLSGIPRQRRFERGWLIRPLLGWNRAAITRYLAHHNLAWISDPANDLAAMDRNFIRHEILPLLKTRFPGAIGAINRSAALNRAALRTLNALAAEDVGRARRSGARLHWPTLAELDPFRRSEAIRGWCLDLGHAPPPGPRLDEFLRQVAVAAVDRTPQMRWDGTCLRYWRDWLWLDNWSSRDAPSWRLSWSGVGAIDLPEPSGRLQLLGASTFEAEDLSVQAARPGERIALPGRACRHRVKDLMLELGVPPWQRTHWPRLYHDGQLVAVGDRWLDVDFAQHLRHHGLQLTWQSKLFQP